MKKYKLSLEKRLKARQSVAKWRVNHAEAAKQHYINYYRKKKGPDYKPPLKPSGYYGAFDKSKKPAGDEEHE